MQASFRGTACQQKRPGQKLGTSSSFSGARVKSRAAPKSKGSKGCQARKGRLVVRAGPVEIDEEDLMQVPDRLKWYDTKFCADDMPDWNEARLVDVQQQGPGLRNIVIECEISRERVPLRNAYKHVGQKACVRVNNGFEYQLTVSSAPFPMELNKDPLFKVRGDLFAHEIKIPKEATSVKAELHLLVSKEEAPELYNVDEDNKIEVGPFAGYGLNLRQSAIMAIYRYPTVIIFTEGKGIAMTRALLESSQDIANLNCKFRQDVRVYYKVPNEASICYRDLFDKWEQELGVKVMTTTVSFQDAFDDDDTLTYNPEYTGAIILVDGDEEATKAAQACCKEAEIIEILLDTNEQAPPVYMDSTPTSFRKWNEMKNGGKGADREVSEVPVGNGNMNSNGNGNGKA